VDRPAACPFTLYAEARRRYMESVAPYARRLVHQMGIPDVDEIDGTLPAVALRQPGTAVQRASWSRIIPETRSSASRVRSDQRYPALIRR
jgi:excinuclease UvrABC ATPase subunit